jgi:WD40 repeat protein
MLFSPDGGQVLSLSDKNVLVLWDLAKVGKNRTLAGPYDDLQSAPYCAYFFPPEDQQPIMAKGARKMKVLGDEAGVERPITILFSADSGPRVFTADAKWLFSSHGLVDVEMGNIAWSAFPGGESGNLVLPTVRHSHCVAISPDGSFGLSGGSPTARPLSLWDLKKGKLAAELAGHKGHVRSVALSRDGKFALSRGDDKFIKLWQVPSGKPLKSFEDPGGAFSEVSFSPDDKLMFSRGTTITAWETATGKLVRSIERPAKEVRHFAYSADGTLGLSGIMDNAVTLWDMKSGKVIRKLNPPDGVPTPIHAVVISPDGKLAVALSGKMHAWNLKTGKLLEVSLRRAANLDLPASRLA